MFTSTNLIASMINIAIESLACVSDAGWVPAADDVRLVLAFPLVLRAVVLGLAVGPLDGRGDGAVLVRLVTWVLRLSAPRLVVR